MNFSADLDLTCALAGKSRVSEISAADLLPAR
jgi:hypothetical protein